MAATAAPPAHRRVRRVLLPGGRSPGRSGVTARRCSCTATRSALLTPTLSPNWTAASGGATHHPAGGGPPCPHSPSCSPSRPPRIGDRRPDAAGGVPGSVELAAWLTTWCVNRGALHSMDEAYLAATGKDRSPRAVLRGSTLGCAGASRMTGARARHVHDERRPTLQPARSPLHTRSSRQSRGKRGDNHV